MRASSLLAGLFSTTALTIHGIRAANHTTITDLLPLIPPCALPCIIKGLSASPETLSDPVSTCTNVTLQAPLSACVQGACNYTEQGRIGILNAQLCEGVPHDTSRQRASMYTALALGPLALFAIILRTYSRWAITKKMGPDDWTMLAAGAVLIGVLACSYENIARNGFGLHYWNIDVFRVTALLKIFYAGELFYVIVITLIKVSIILFYLRVFPTKWFRVANIITMVLLIAAGVGCLIPIFFQCSPVRGAWDRTIQAKCININLLAYATGGIGVGFDVIILVLPIPELLKLKMSPRKKRNVMFMFSLGGIATITSMVRLKYLADFATSTDPTWDNTIPVIVSLIEICVAVICACLPALRALVCHWLPTFFPGDSTNGSQSNPPRNYVSGNSDAKTTSESKSIASGISDKGFEFSQSNSLPSARPNLKAEKSGKQNRNSWFNNVGHRTRDRQQVQDIERGSVVSNVDSVKPLASTNMATPTTSAWTDNSPTVTHFSSVHRLHPSTAHSRDLSRNQVSTKHSNDTSTFFHSTDCSSNESLNRSDFPSRDASPSIKSVDDRASSSKGLHHRIERTGSEDSMFALEGPRESDDEERKILEQSANIRGRGSGVRESEKVDLTKAREQEIEMRRLSHEQGGSVQSESRSSIARQRVYTQSQNQSQTRVNRISPSLEQDMEVFGRGQQQVPRKVRSIPVSIFNQNPPEFV